MLVETHIFDYSAAFTVMIDAEFGTFVRDECFSSIQNFVPRVRDDLNVSGHGIMGRQRAAFRQMMCGRMTTFAGGRLCGILNFTVSFSGLGINDLSISRLHFNLIFSDGK